MDSNCGRCVDWISKIPDEVLSHIFSFLPIRDVVRTSVLSKRWEYAWKYAPCLDLVYQPGILTHGKDSVDRLACFKKFVDRVLFHRGGSSIKKCALDCYSAYPCPSFYAWVETVLACNVRELYLSGSFKGFALPPSLFTCRTLVVLKINGWFVLNVPFDVFLPSLKTLSLYNVVYPDGFSMQMLFSGCPVLEVLKIERRCGLDGCDGVSTTTISIPSLKRLVFYFRYRPRTWIGEEVRSEYRMLIDTPCLESLGLFDNVSEAVSVNFSESLVGASINGSCASKVLKEISHVKELSLYGDAMKNLNAASDSTVPFFRNLVVLELEIYGIADQNLLTSILTNSPKLEVLYLFRSLEPGSHFCDSPWNPPESPPDCLVNLKRVKFSDFLGTTFELSLVRYILEHALVLKKMLISFRDFGIETMYTPQMQSSRDEISRYRKGSSSCQVQFGESNWICQKRDPFG